MMKGPNDALAKYQMLAGSYFSIEPPVPVSTFNFVLSNGLSGPKRT
jgi:hypothetical protein